MRVGVFVDAGYVYAAGSCTLTGEEKPKPRSNITISESVFVALLTATASRSSGGKELLRIYWYDGVAQSGRSDSQDRLANLDNVKMRLGNINSAGQQKGVDSLIVTDLAELARNKAISDAILVTGDEDILVGMQTAQAHGIRVHLFGINGGPRHWQSDILRKESDTAMLWDRKTVATFLSISQSQTQQKIKVTAEALGILTGVHPDFQDRPEDRAKIDNAVNQTFAASTGDKTGLDRAAKVVRDGKDIPGDMVKVLNSKLKTVLGCEPTREQKTNARNSLASKLKELR